MSLHLSLDIADALAREVASRTTVHEYGAGVLVDLPWDFGDGDGLAVYVEEVGGGMVNLTDRGLTADVLALAGVDLASPAARKSWDAIRSLVTQPAPFGRDLDEYEIATFTNTDNVARALHEVAATMLRAEGLRAIGTRTRRVGLSDRIIRRAHGAGLKVVPRAEVATRFGGSRQVTAQVIGGRDVFMQAVGSAATEAYDHTRAIFGDAELTSDRLVAVVAADVKLDRWQVSALTQDGTVIDEPDLPEFLSSLAAA